MTLKELSQLYYLKREIEHDKKRLAELESKAYAASSPNLSGQGFGSGVSDRVSRYAVKLAECRSIIEAKQKRCIDERIRLEKYICDISDSLTRQIFTLRFADGLSWIAVARRIGGNSTSDGVKKICYRYLKQNK